MERTAKLVFTKQKTEKIKVTFPFNWGDVEVMRLLPVKKKFHKVNGEKYWTCDVSIEAIEMLQENKFEIGKNLKKILDDAYVDMEELRLSTSDENLDSKLYPFQREAINFLNQRMGKGLLALEQGLGKTIIALAWLYLNPDHRPIIAVVPATAKYNWEREINKWLPSASAEVLNGMTPYEITGDFVIINYDILKEWQDVIRDFNPRVLILDESQMIKNNKAQRTKATKIIAKKVPCVMCLSGTPVLNRPVEIYNTIQLIDRTIYPSFWDYVHKFCDAKHTRYGWDFNGAKSTDKLHKKLVQTIMFRKKKEDVLKELPPKIIQYLPIELSNKQEYEMAEKDFIKFIQNTKGRKAAKKASNAEQLAKVETLKQVAVKNKLPGAIKWIEETIENDTKLIVFCTHRFVVDKLMEVFNDKAVKVDGSVTGTKRQDAIDKFNSDKKVSLFVGNMRAAGAAINLQTAFNVAFLELGWSPADHDQATDRAHRIGQENTVNVYYLIANSTIEDKIATVIDDKRQVVDKIVDGTQTAKSHLLKELIKSYSYDTE